MSTFVSLVRALEKWFDKPLASLPTPERTRVERDFPVASLWDELTPDRRRTVAAQWDYQNDPALEEQRTIDWDETVVDWTYWRQVPSLTAQEFSILRHVHDPRKFDADRNGIPGGEGKTLGERVSDDVRIIERTSGADSKKPIQEWLSWAREKNWELPAYLRIHANASGEDGAEQVSRCKPVTSTKIKAAFIIKGQSSDQWWDTRFRNAKDYGLVALRASPGRGKRPSQWYPDQIAAWLVQKKRMRATQAANILRDRFPECAEAADLLLLDSRNAA